jgi:hypothetical protein
VNRITGTQAVTGALNILASTEMVSLFFQRALQSRFYGWQNHPTGNCPASFFVTACTD